jgi:hypothetical protein
MTTAKTLGRRLFARAAVGVPTALKFSEQQLGSGQLSGSNLSRNGCGMAVTAPFTKGESAKAELRHKIWEALRVKARPEEEIMSVRRERRYLMGGLDPDLSVLNSMSLVRRAQIQIDREIEIREKAKGFRAWLVRSMGGNPEEFE